MLRLTFGRAVAGVATEEMSLRFAENALKIKASEMIRHQDDDNNQGTYPLFTLDQRYVLSVFLLEFSDNLRVAMLRIFLLLLKLLFEHSVSCLGGVQFAFHLFELLAHLEM